eukprot:CAMPEP_0181115280 /NCGR_PEP_ID=MMETSP1071-20121207/21347_1 /TAXON_ID=35127 /ORGANISM="Thalassiosira sp., Strain NH16" /LENGTH=522 /DNA_ID=CAMNT_0023199475 /DNA_START=13 /DNA_END=1581 /DNA_ORIENTATION=-
MPPHSALSTFHRGDPLDIPLIDDHILTRLLLPRIASAIEFVLPRAHLDWTTGTTTTAVTSHDIGLPYGYDDDADRGDYGHRDALFWKGAAEALLRACLVLASCRRIYADAGGGGGKGTTYSYAVTTPAMRSLGMSLRPTAYGVDGGRRSRVRRREQYGRVAALVVVTVILPNLYRWLNRRRERQLEEAERRSRWEELRRDLRPSSMGGNGRRQTRQQHRGMGAPSQHDALRRRARERKSLLSSLATDAVLGAGDILLPPLRLANRLAYLWGIGGLAAGTPHLGLRLAGWEYAPEPGGGDGGSIGQRYQRHANFQYGNRRLLVEEGLRTVSMILPPRRIDGDNGDNLGGFGRGAGAATVDVGGHPRSGATGRASNGGEAEQGSGTRMPAADGDSLTRRTGEREHGGPSRGGGILSRMNSAARRTVGNRNSWIRKRYLSFMGIAEDENLCENDDAPSSVSDAAEARRYSLTCSMCHVENPAVPYIASCGHCYCYMCLRMAVTDDLTFRCVDCGQKIVSSSRPRC